MSRDKILKMRTETSGQEALAPMPEVVTYARLARKGAGWEVLAVDLPPSVVSQFERVASEYDLYSNQERKLLIESRKTDFQQWK